MLVSCESDEIQVSIETNPLLCKYSYIELQILVTSSFRICHTLRKQHKVPHFSDITPMAIDIHPFYVP